MMMRRLPTAPARASLAVAALSLLAVACSDVGVDLGDLGEPDRGGVDAGADPDASTDPDVADLGIDAATDAADLAPDGDLGVPDAGDLGPDGPDAGDAGDDADAADSSDGGSDGGPAPPTRYVDGRIHSLLTPSVAENLRSIAARNAAMRDDVFMKVGDSITVGTPFLHCLADGAVDLQGRSDLEATRAHFAAADDLVPAGGGSPTTPFDRTSLASVSGRTASWAITPPEGGAAPLLAERDDIDPRFAVVMFGTNDIGWYPSDFPRMFRWYGESMLVLVDELLDSGVVPVLSTVPPRLDSPAVLDPRVSSMNALVWGLAQARQVPLVDFHLALEPLAPDWGLAGDGVHPSVSCDGGVRCGCRFDATGLEYGYNVRNWITLEALDRVRRVVLDGAPAPDTPQRAALEGSGTAEDPFVIEALPFADYRDTNALLGDAIDEYTGCGATQDESGPEVYYALDLSESTDIGALVIDRAGVDIDLHVLADSADPANCLVRNDTFAEETLPAGHYILVLDTWVNGSGTALPGEYLFVVHER